MTPEQVIEIVDSRIQQLFIPAPPSKFMTDEEVRELLRISGSKLRVLIARGELVQGAHFTGSRSNRIWIRERVERYIETRDNVAVQLRDIKAWKRG